MKTLIYMSEEIKKKDPDVNRVTIRQTGKRLRYGGSLNLVKDGEVLARIRVNPKGLRTTPKHHVRAWVETKLEVELA